MRINKIVGALLLSITMSVSAAYEVNDLKEFHSYGNRLSVSSFNDYINYVDSDVGLLKEKALSNIIRKSVSNDDYKFMYSIMNMYGDVEDSKFNYRAVLEYLVYSKNYIAAYSYLGDLYINEGDVERGLSVIVKGSDVGDNRSSFLLGGFYENGVNVEGSDYFAIRSYMKVKKGYYYGDAVYRAALINRKINKIEESNKLMYISANSGYVKACSDIIDNDIGVKSEDNYEKNMLRFLICAVDGGNHAYAYKLAEMYYDGYLMDADIVLAKEYYDLYYNYALNNLIDLTDVELHRIAVSMMRNRDIKALELFGLSSEKGNFESSYVLAKIYENGASVIMDYDKALYYYELSKKQGKENIQEDIDRVESLINE